MFLFISCSTLFEMDEPCGCGLNITSELPMVNGVYHLPYNNNLSMTYSHLYAETDCGLFTKISWDSDYQFEIVEEPMEKHLQKAFIRYNDTQDKHRKGKTWRELLPELESALTINTN